MNTNSMVKAIGLAGKQSRVKILEVFLVGTSTATGPLFITKLNASYEV
jgi:hypothetical protein